MKIVCLFYLSFNKKLYNFFNTFIKKFVIIIIYEKFLQKMRFFILIIILHSYCYSKTKVFNLNDCINIAFSNSTAVQNASENLLQAEINKEIQFAVFYPNLSLKLSDNLTGYESSL